MEKSKGIKSSVFIMLMVNILFVATIIIMLVSYNSNYGDKLNAENVANITNINASAANIADIYFSNRQMTLEDVRSYFTDNSMGYEQTLKYLSMSTSGQDDLFELIRPDCTGHIISHEESGEHISVDYSNPDYGKLKRIFTAADGADTGVHSTPEFTGGHTAYLSFAQYVYIPIKDENGQIYYCTLMIVQKSSQIAEVVNVEGGYENMSSALIESNGDYILSTNSFRDTNFFDYLYNYNKLTLDRRNDIMNEFAEKGSGEVIFLDKQGRKAIFCYTRVGDRDWFCVTSVPVSSFHTNTRSMTIVYECVLIMFVMLIFDVTWLNSLNRRLKISMSMEKEANNAKTNFLSRMSHDIRTPLNGIIGSTILAREENNPPQTEEYLGVIESSGRFLLGLVNDILDMSKVESGKMDLHPEPYRYSELCGYINSVIKPLCKEKNIEFIIDGSSDGSALMLDRLRFNQIFFNLLSNAVKFTAPGGKVEMIVKEKRLEGGRYAIDVTVRDNGIGMSDEFREHMFETFSQEGRSNDSSVTGTGLGLAIVDNLVNLMGGSISVESKINEGTAFTVHLEANSCDGKQLSETDDTPVHTESLSGKRILLCEDNLVNSMLAQKLLEKKDMISEVAQNGKEGVDMFLRSEPGHYNMILMDIMMPVMNGIDATKEIRGSEHTQAKTIPIIAMTANAYTSDVEKCLEAGMNSHIAKPIEPALMYEEMSKYI